MAPEEDEANQRIEPMKRSEATFILNSATIDALLAMAHPHR
jgi:hypothetical protein